MVHNEEGECLVANGCDTVGVANCFLSVAGPPQNTTENTKLKPLAHFVQLSQKYDLKGVIMDCYHWPPSTAEVETCQGQPGAMPAKSLQIEFPRNLTVGPINFAHLKKNATGASRSRLMHLVPTPHNEARCREGVKRAGTRTVSGDLSDAIPSENSQKEVASPNELHLTLESGEENSMRS